MKKILTIDENGFRISGKKFNLYSGAVHYFRHHPAYWLDRLQKLQACGLNTVETYIAWNVHETAPDEFTFDGFADFERFLEIADALGLYAIVRPGPFICAEWEMGGLPAWLTEIEGIELRRYNKPFLERVDKYFDAVIPKIRSHLTTNGGNVIAVQVENEYGGLGVDDKAYLEYIKDGLITRGIDVPLFTSDGIYNGDLERGSVDGVFMTANFGSKYEYAYERVKSLQPDLPFVCMEFWNTWFDQWGVPRHSREPESVIRELLGIINAGGGFNLYMFAGGTNFGFMNGSNCNPKFEPTITSYDYGAPLNEYGGYTETYTKIRELLAPLSKKPLPVPPAEAERRAYGSAVIQACVPLFDVLDKASTEYITDKPYNMEHFGQMYGYILYTVNASGYSGRLDIGVPHDRAQIFGDGVYLGVIERDGVCDEVEFNGVTTLQILVENMGHVNFGPRIYDKKGILSDIKIGNTVVASVTQNCIPFKDLSGVVAGDTRSVTPMLYRCTFTVDEAADTFLLPDGCTRGAVLLNGFNLGRYNEVGPQRTLYIPAPLLREGENEVIVLDLEPKSEPKVQLIDTHILG